MSIEKNLDTIAASLASIAASLEKLVAAETVVKTVQDKPAKKEVQVVAPEPVAAPAPAPVLETMTVPTVAAPAQVEAPAIPTVVVQSGSVPFTDAKSLMQWIMEKYKALGPAKGAGIQTVLQELGCANVNALKPEQYGVFHAKVEAL